MTASTNNIIHKISSYFKNQPILRAWLYGSFARGEETGKSDVDIMVDYDKSNPISLLKVCDMMIELEEILGKKVDLVENGRLKDFAIDSANNDRILIYERAC